MEVLWRVVQSMKTAAAAAGVEFVTGDTDLITGIPTGDWLLERRADANGVTNVAWSAGTEDDVGRFDMTIGNPIQGGIPIVVVPNLVINYDSNNSDRIEFLEVTWYQHDGVDTYELVTDTALLDELLGGWELSIDDFPDVTEIEGRVDSQANGISFTTSTVPLGADPSAGGILETTRPIFYDSSNVSCPQTDDVYEADYIGIGYSLAGQNFRFVFRCGDDVS